MVIKMQYDKTLRTPIFYIDIQRNTKYCWDYDHGAGILVCFWNQDCYRLFWWMEY